MLETASLLFSSPISIEISVAQRLADTFEATGL